MAVSYVGVTNGNTVAGTSNSLVTTLPSGWAAGDVAVLVGHVSGGSLNMTTPAGWTVLPGPSWPVTEGSASRMYGWYRVLQAGDTAPTIAINGAMTGGWECTAHRGASGVAQASTSTASGTSVTLPTLSGVLAGSALAAVAHCRVASGTIPTNLSPNVAYTEVVDHATSRVTSSANVRMAAAYRLVGSAGSYGGETVGSTTTGSMIGLLVELTAAASDPTTTPDGFAVPVEVGSPAAAAVTTGSPDGIAVPAAAGPPTAAASTSGAPDGVALPVAVGLPSAGWSGQSSPDGLALSVSLGVLSAHWSMLAEPDGLAVPVAAGSPDGGFSAATTPDGVAVPVELGSPSTPGAATVPDGLLVGVALGEPAAAWSITTGPDGLAVPVDLGSPTTGTPGQGVPRPSAPAVARPSAVAVARPSASPVARPAAAAVVRPTAAAVTRPRL